MEGDGFNPMEGGAVLVVRASNLQEELQREAVYVEVAHEGPTSGGLCSGGVVHTHASLFALVGKRANRAWVLSRATPWLSGRDR